MAYTTNELIAGAFYASGVVSREFETVSGQQIGDGLSWLNDILTEKTVDDGMVPYESTYSFTAVPGQEIYSIPDLISIDTLVFFKQSVRFSMSYTKRNAYFGSNRVESIRSLPYQWYFERKFGGGNLYIYFTADQNYPMELHGTFRLAEVALNQDLSLTIDKFYTTYLRYALADRICSEYNYVTPPNVVKQLGKYEGWIDKKSKLIDLQLEKASSLQGSNATYSWAWINLGRGFLP
jgi:hypothetical protein